MFIGDFSNDYARRHLHPPNIRFPWAWEPFPPSWSITNYCTVCKSTNDQGICCTWFVNMFLLFSKWIISNGIWLHTQKEKLSFNGLLILSPGVERSQRNRKYKKYKPSRLRQEVNRKKAMVTLNEAIALLEENNTLELTKLKDVEKLYSKL